MIGSDLKLLDNVFAVIEDVLLLIELFPGLLVHLLDASPVHFDSVLELLNSGLDFLLDCLKLIFDVALKGLEMGSSLGDLER
jgi:hypothetical protein